MADLDLAGIITRACANLRLRFSKVTVTRSLTSGTKSATVTVDGVNYDLYAPTPPTASTTAPLMDGTASYGSGTSYARSNHRHPTDTSRQETLVSGTNIKTVGGTSLLGSGDIPITITMEDTDVDAAVEAAWPGYSVTVSLTHPLYGENFNKCQIEGYADGGNITDILGLIIDPAGSMTVAFDSDTYEYLSLMFDARWGASFMESNITCTGGVSYYTETAMTNRLFVVTGSGTITINGIDYDD